MSTTATNKRAQALRELYSHLQKSNISGALFEYEEPDPVVYTQDTCTRVREGQFFIRRVSRHGVVLETASISVERVPVAASLVRAMGAVRVFSS